MSKRRGPGRPPKVTPEAIEKLCSALSAGNFRGPSAEWAGISIRTFSEWMRAGKEQKTGRYRDFRRRVLEAEKAAEIRAVGLVMKASQEDPRHAEWWLERKFPERWGRKEAVKIDPTVVRLEGEATVQVQHTAKVELGPERLQRVAMLLERVGVLEALRGEVRKLEAGGEVVDVKPEGEEPGT